MIIEISSSGGFGGLPAAALSKRIDVDQQSTALQRELCEYFEPRDLRQLAAAPCRSRCADPMIYRITVTDERSGRHIYTLREDQLPPGMLDLIDQM